MENYCCVECGENNWTIQAPDENTVRATCRYCRKSVDFSGRIREVAPPTSKVKITKVGQLCRDCTTPVVHRSHAKPPKYKGQSYYYSLWLHCPKCKKDYFLDEHRVMFDAPLTLPMQPAAPESAFNPAQIEDGVAPWENGVI